MRSDLYDVEVEFQCKTVKAVCVRAVEDGEDIWLPLAQVEIEGRQRRGVVVKITAPETLLNEKGLI